jgi:hypothetical protein
VFLNEYWDSDRSITFSWNEKNYLILISRENLSKSYRRSIPVKGDPLQKFASAVLDTRLGEEKKLFFLSTFPISIKISAKLIATCTAQPLPSVLIYF